jgi:hypothetical protein
MRKIIHELISPTVKRSHEDRETLVQLKSVVLDHHRRLKPIEYALYKSEDPTDAFDALHRKIADMEKRRIEDQTKLGHQMENLKDFVDSFQIKFDKASSERTEIVNYHYNSFSSN